MPSAAINYETNLRYLRSDLLEERQTYAKAAFPYSLSLAQYFIRIKKKKQLGTAVVKLNVLC